jgi:hypothetical protein
VELAGRILTSPDGITYTKQLSGTTSTPLKEIIYANYLFVTVGSNGTILTSPDGITWTEQTSGIINILMNITHANDIFVAVGSNQTILACNPPMIISLT